MREGYGLQRVYFILVELSVFFELFCDFKEAYLKSINVFIVFDEFLKMVAL